MDKKTTIIVLSLFLICIIGLVAIDQLYPTLEQDLEKYSPKAPIINNDSLIADGMCECDGKDCK